MAFNTGQSNSNNDSWKAQAFINLYLPSADGDKPMKLGAIPLKMSVPSEKGLIEWLKADPTRVASILSSMTADFREVDANPTKGFKLG